ncbi:MAG TPA: serine/threonine-protein kinase [Actinomycetes bacterium]
MVESERPLDDPRGLGLHAVQPRPAGPGDPGEIGPYRVLGRLGAGGMGAVYLAESPAGARVAIKVIRPELAGDAAFLDRFRREVDAARRVAGFCTAQVLDANLDGAAPYLVTEYVDGVRLDLVVERDGPLAASNLEGLAVGVAAALAAIHAAEVVHRDLKPGNVLLSYFGPRVIDFGIARALDDASTAITRAGTVMGTPAWMAPEQFGSAPVTTAADIFAWGGLVAYAGTGRLAFGRGPVEVLAYRIVHQPPDLDGLAGPLRPLVERAMAKDAARRPSARDLLEELLDDPSDPGNVRSEVTRVLRRTWVQEPRTGPAQPAPSGPAAEVPTATAPAPGAATTPAPGAATAPAPPAADGAPRREQQVPAWAHLPRAPQPSPRLPPPGPTGRQATARPAPEQSRPTGWAQGPEPARPTGWGVPPPAGPRTPGKARLRGVLVALAIVVFGVLASLNNGDHGGGQSGSDSGRDSSDSGGTEVTQSQGGSGYQAGHTPAHAPYAPVRDGKFEFRVTRFGCGPRVLGSGATAVRAQGKFCLLTMSVRNIGREPQNVDANAQYLYAVGGSRNQVDAGATLRAGSRLPLARVNPGNSVSGTLVYDVPTSFRPRAVELHDSALSRGVRLSLT